MALTPIDVQQKTFGTALRGYDLDEVDDFLDEVVTSLNGYEQRLSDAQQRISALEAELAGKGDSESAISRALVAAQRSADMIVEEANAEADRLLADARAQAEMLAAVRDEERAKLTLEVSSMRAGVSEIREKVRELAASLESELEEMDRSVAAAEAELAVEPAAAAGAPTTPIVAVAAEVTGDGPTGVVGDLPGSTVDVESDVLGDVEDAWVGGAGEPSIREESPPVPDPDDQPGQELQAPAEVRWAPSWGDEPTIGASTSSAARDPLEEALAEATFTDDGAPAPSPEDAVPAVADVLHTDETEDAGEAWERAGLEGWSDESEADEADRPRRPWE